MAADTFRYDRLGGYVQKGPYLNGTSLQVAELREDLTLTGKTYSTQLIDNRGTFELRDIALVSQYVQLQANGFYFNEVTNENSSAQLTLFALSDLKGKSTLNVNLLSTLERGRAEYLIDRGIDFSAAKLRAQQEILAMFKLEGSTTIESELMDITQPGEDNAKLLAISVILQSYLSVADLSELVANISTDIRTDGVLDSELLGSTLVNSAVALQLPEVRANLENRYELLGLTVQVPDFEKYVQRFIDSTSFAFTNHIKYPVQGTHGPNLLSDSLVNFAWGKFSLHAKIPISSSVRVYISGPNWEYAYRSAEGWTVSGYDQYRGSREFTASENTQVDLDIRLTRYDPWGGEPRDAPYNPQPDSTGHIPGPSFATDTTRILVYENGSDTASWEKKFVLE